MTQPKDDIVAATRETADGVLKAAKEALRQTAGRVAVAPLAVVLCRQQVLTVPIFDINQRVQSLRSVVREHGGEGFALMYNGRLQDAMGSREAVFIVWLTRSGQGGAAAYPYTVAPLTGLIFYDPVVQDTVAQSYRSVFGQAAVN